MGSESPPGEPVGFVTFTDLPVPESLLGGPAWAVPCPLLWEPLQGALCVPSKASAAGQLQDQGLKSRAPALVLHLAIKHGEAAMGQLVYHTLSTLLSLKRVG